MSPPLKDSKIVVIGAGVVGLSVTKCLAQRGFTDILLLESLKTFGQGTSSRNSCVLHAGIYYPYNSWKRKLCIQGHRRMLNFCREYKVNHEICGKLIVDDRIENDRKSQDSNSGVLDPLMQIYQTGINNGAVLELIDDPNGNARKTLQCLEPNLSPHISRAIYSPLTGIVDSHEYMMALQFLSEDNGVQICWECEVEGAQSSSMSESDSDSQSQSDPSKSQTKIASAIWDAQTGDSRPKKFNNASTHQESDTNTSSQFLSILKTNQGDIDDISFIVNCSGLYACDIASQKLNIANVPRAIYAQGNYWKPDFSDSSRINSDSSIPNLQPKKHPKTDLELAKEHLTKSDVTSSDQDLAIEKHRYFNHLIYPLPEPGGLGTHLTLDLDGSIRFGPNVVWLKDKDSSTKADSQQDSKFLHTLTPETEHLYYTPQEADEKVYSLIRRYFPGLQTLVPDYAGIRPKIEAYATGSGSSGSNNNNIISESKPSTSSSKPSDDFMFLESMNTISCLGIESPGLTCSLAIGERIAERVEEKLREND